MASRVCGRMARCLEPQASSQTEVKKGILHVSCLSYLGSVVAGRLISAAELCLFQTRHRDNSFNAFYLKTRDTRTTELTAPARRDPVISDTLSRLVRER